MADKPKIKFMGVEGTQELINLIKADFAKKQDIIQFTEMPSPVECVGRDYQYVGETNMHFQNGHFYHSNGFTWSEVYKGLDGKTWQLIDSLPPYDSADFETMYFVYNDEGSVQGYIKGPEKMEPISTTHTWKIVSGLPAWEDARVDTMYLVNADNKIEVYIKNPEESDKWYSLKLKAKVWQYPDEAHYDEDAQYPDEPEEFNLAEMELKAIRDSDIKRLFEEA